MPLLVCGSPGAPSALPPPKAGDIYLASAPGIMVSPLARRGRTREETWSYSAWISVIRAPDSLSGGPVSSRAVATPAACGRSSVPLAFA